MENPPKRAQSYVPREAKRLSDDDWVIEFDHAGQAPSTPRGGRTLSYGVARESPEESSKVATEAHEATVSLALQDLG